MAVTLTSAAKNWLAIHAGIGNCFSSSGISYLDAEGIPHTGSTGDVVNAFMVAHMVGNDTAIIINNTNYTQFKSINGGVDIGFDDANFAYTNDGNPGTEPTYCAPPPNIISTLLTLDKNICTEPCTVIATITWTNNGGSPGTFSPGIIVDGGLPTTMPPESLVDGTSVSHSFSIVGLTVAGSPHSICASPGVNCQTAYTVTSINICNWVVSKGGWNVLAVYDIMMMVSAYLGQTNIGFTVTIAHIMGAVAYYLDKLSNGNSLTGCTFT